MKNKLNFDVLILGILAVLMVLSGLLWWVIDRQTLALPDCPQEAMGVYGPLKVHFSLPMEHISVENSFSFNPTVGGHFSWSGNDLLFWPEAPLNQTGQYQFTMQAGIRTLAGRMISETKSCPIKLRAMEVVYESIEAKGSRLFRVGLDGKEKIELGRFDGLILSYDVALDGEFISLAVKNGLNGSDIWLVSRNGKTVKQLVDCQKDHCETPVWEPRQQRILYSRQPAERANGRETRLWLVDALTLKTTPFIVDEKINGLLPHYSPDGKCLAFFDPQENGIRIIRLEDGQTVFLEANSGVMAWSPDSKSLIYYDQGQENGNGYTSAMLYSIEEKKSRLLLDEYKGQFEFGEPDWTPDGKWITMAARLARSESSPSKQLVMLKIDGSAVKTITSEQIYNNSAYHWGVDGRWLVFQRYPFGSSSAKPEIMLWDQQTEQTSLLLTEASSPTWLP